MSTRTVRRIYWSLIAVAFVAMLFVRGNAPGTPLDMIAAFAICGGDVLIARYWPDHAAE